MNCVKLYSNSQLLAPESSASLPILIYSLYHKNVCLESGIVKFLLELDIKITNTLYRNGMPSIHKELDGYSLGKRKQLTICLYHPAKYYNSVYKYLK